jgi:multidrug resistance protein, MATE family
MMQHLAVINFRFIDGKEAWGGFSKKAFHNWGPMLGFATSGVVMTCSEVSSHPSITAYRIVGRI